MSARFKVSDFRTPVLVGTFSKGMSIVASLGLGMLGVLSSGSWWKPLEERSPLEERFEPGIEQ